MPVAFLQELLRMNSSNPPGNEHEISKVLATRCERIGMPGKILKLNDQRSNFEVRLKGQGEKVLFFCGHMDTVSPGKIEWDYPPYSGEIVDNRLYGRGASDMKSGLAAMLLAMEELHQEGKVLGGDIVFLATAGEEVDSCGARNYQETVGMRDVDAIVIAEPTHEKVVIGHKGALWLEIKTFGKTAHGSMPDQGINAIEHMMRVIELIQSYNLEWRMESDPLGQSSMTVTQIGAGIQTNVIPDQCFLHVDIRSVPPQSHKELVAELRSKLENWQRKVPGFRAECRELLDRAAVLTDSSSSIIQTALQIKGQGQKDCYGVSYYTDASVLNPYSKIPTLIYGPGDEKLAHQPNEWVDISAYLRSIAFYKELATRFLSS
ncbi:M20 family metallopeptidase [Ammoniphilus sp. CFH 90114]|uniref:M20 family metallopeptidase n=1 Tax=Ammoniphilus sp. CFH 90114 TaxID=2493665 RepID=UPI00100FEED0|nr:M20 family metallopeptidase [Ammoniphilus sp. CFH 90114]RXT05758.1 M20 family peptidase [Ammoniphilus sp. CFH 90114]